MKYAASFVFTIVLFTFFGCKNEKPASEDLSVDYSEDIKGRWEIQAAFRNNKPTQSLDNTFFEFNSNNTMSSNFNMSGTAQEGTYSLDEQTLTQLGATNFVHTIDSISDSTLVLSTRFRGYDFRLLLKKQ